MASSVFVILWLGSAIHLLTCAAGGARAAPTSFINKLPDSCSCTSIRKQHTCKTCKLNSVNFRGVSESDISAVSQLQGASILFIGDSLSWQTAHSASCYLGPSAKISIDFKAMYTIPVRMEDFEQEIEAFGVYNYTDVVFQVGTWYNWNWTQTQAEEEIIDAKVRITAETSKDILDAQCQSNQFEKMANAQNVFLRSKEEQKCFALTGRESYKSAIHRIITFAKKVEESGKGPNIFWKQVPPQHFSYTPSGQYLVNGNSGSVCAPIKDPDGAYARNRAAENVLKHTKIPIIRTWGYDVDKWNSHSDPCTHYCSPSPSTWNWVARTMEVIAASRTSYKQLLKK